MTTPNENPARNIKVIGVGSAGHNIVQQLLTRALPGLQFAVLNTEAPAGAVEFIPLAAKAVRDLDVASAAQVDAVLAEALPRLQAWLTGADVVFVVAGLGGKTGSGLAPAVARAAKASGALTLGFATTPFACEASRRARQAEQGLARWRAEADGVICLANEKILRLIDENTSLLDTFKISNELLTDGLRGVWQLLNYNGLIEIHFDDLRDLIRDGKAENVFATAEASGPNRGREVVEKLVAHPLLDGGRALGAAQSALVSIVGGPGLSMAEVNRVMEQINRQCEGAQVLMGAAIDETFKDRLAVTLIVAHGEAASHSAPAAELDTQFLHPTEVARPASRFVPPPPALTPEKMELLAARRVAGGRSRKSGPKMTQEQLPLEIVSKGRFDKSEPTVRNGEDLDQPTFIRRGMVLN